MIFLIKGNLFKKNSWKLIYYVVNIFMKTTSQRRTSYFVTFFDDFKKKAFVYFTNQKLECLKKFKIFKALGGKNMLDD